MDWLLAIAIGVILVGLAFVGPFLLVIIWAAILPILALVVVVVMTYFILRVLREEREEREKKGGP